MAFEPKHHASNSTDHQDPMGLAHVKANELTAAQRRLRIVQLVVAGFSYDMIGSLLNMSSRQVLKRVKEEVSRLEALSLNTLEHERRVELTRCDEFLRSLWPRIQKGDARAIEVALKVSERRSKLLGLDAPEKTSVTLDVTIENLTHPELLAEAERLGLPLLELKSLPNFLPGEILDAEILSSTPLQELPSE